MYLVCIYFRNGFTMEIYGSTHNLRTYLARAPEAKRREVLSYAPLQSRDMDLPDPTREPDSFASIMLGIDWIDDIEIQVFCISFLAELKALRAELIQP